MACVQVTVILTVVGMKKSITLSSMTTGMYIASILHYVCVLTYAEGSEGEKGLYVFVRVLVLGACVCECVTPIQTLYPRATEK